MKIKTRRYYVYYIACVAGFSIAILPLRVGLFLAELAGKISYALLEKGRKVTLRNLRDAFPEKSDREIEGIAKGVFVTLCRNAVEWLNIYKLTKKNLDAWITSEDFKKIDEAYSKGNGVLILASHFGNWELSSFCFTLKGYKSTAIARRIYFDRYNNFIQKMRASKNVNVVYRDESPKKFLRILRKNEVLGLLADQDMDSVGGVFVDFFGKPTYTAKAPVTIAMASKAPLIPLFVIRGPKKHRLIIEDPIEIEIKATKEETIKYNTQKWTRLLESYIRKYPDHWVWMHKRWKTKPEAEK
ncbi:MAG: lysophospholipid acyltransferase family protein [Omnitrophica bacterium]|nr:lysophospholipid acyltransferase family protein [Candidatus Omnitrophota bacterium]